MKGIKRNMEIHHSWCGLPVKDRIAYIMAVVLIASGIVMAFCAFFLTEGHNISGSVLGYCGEVFTTGGALLGVGLYVTQKMGEVVSSVPNLIHDIFSDDERLRGVVREEIEKKNTNKGDTSL